MLGLKLHNGSQCALTAQRQQSHCPEYIRTLKKRNKIIHDKKWWREGEKGREKKRAV